MRYTRGRVFWLFLLIFVLLGGWWGLRRWQHSDPLLNEISFRDGLYAYKTFLPDGQHLLLMNAEKTTVDVYNLNQQTVVTTLQLPQGVDPIDYTYVLDDLLLTLAPEPWLWSIQLAGAPETLAFPSSIIREEIINIVSLNQPNQALLFLQDGSVYQWDWASNTAAFLMKVPPPSSIAVNYDGSFLALNNDQTKTVDLYNRFQLDQPTSLAVDGAIANIVFSPDGTHIAVGVMDTTMPIDGDTLLAPTQLILWNVSTRQIIHQWEQPLDRVWDVQFSPDGQWVAIAGGPYGVDSVEAEIETQIYVYSATAESVTKIFPGHRLRVHQIMFTPESTSIWSVGDDNMVREWAIK